jgi:hypothetical protein
MNRSRGIVTMRSKPKRHHLTLILKLLLVTEQQSKPCVPLTHTAFLICGVLIGDRLITIAAPGAWRLRLVI